MSLLYFVVRDCVYDVVVKKVHVRYLISWWVSCYITRVNLLRVHQKRKRRFCWCERLDLRLPFSRPTSRLCNWASRSFETETQVWKTPSEMRCRADNMIQSGGRVSFSIRLLYLSTVQRPASDCSLPHNNCLIRRILSVKLVRLDAAATDRPRVADQRARHSPAAVPGVRWIANIYRPVRVVISSHS